jgi:hypothetical protein
VDQRSFSIFLFLILLFNFIFATFKKSGVKRTKKFVFATAFFEKAVKWQK